MSNRERNLIWDAMDECFGETRTKSERTRRGKAVAELNQAKVTPEELKIAYEYCAKRFTHFTEFALCNWLSRAIKEHDDSQAGRDTFLRLLKREEK